MSQNQEIIESKLCAFIDGELDAEGRAEIEKHLEANPQHRRLLESLKATRDLLKWLPREAAPPEVAETLNGQLERSVLLDDGNDSLRPTMWPRIFAAAAIILLTTGLFAAVYFTLPKSQKSATPYAREAVSAPPVEATPGETDRTLAATERPDAAGAVAMKGGLAGKAAELADKTESVADEKKPDLDRLAMEVNQNRAAIVAAANGLTNGATPGANNSTPALTSNAMVVLVRSNSPPDTRRQLATYLDSQKILWKQAESEEQSNSGPAQEAQQVDARKRSPSLGQQQQQSGERDAGRNSAAAGATTQESQSYAAAAPNAVMQRQQQEAPAPSAPATQQSTFAMSGLGAQGGDVAGGLYVARMSRQQAVLLSNTISQEGSQTAELKELENNFVAQVAGPTTNETREELARSRRSFGAAGTVEIGRPTTRPAETLALAKDSEATTQPAPADEPLCVVIVLQSAAAGPATQPTTAPATTEPASSGVPQTQPSQQ